MAALILTLLLCSSVPALAANQPNIITNIVTNAENILKDYGVDDGTLESAKAYLRDSLGDTTKIEEAANSAKVSIEKAKDLLNINFDNVESLEDVTAEIQNKLAAATDNLATRFDDTLTQVTGLSAEERNLKLAGLSQFTGISSLVENFGDYLRLPWATSEHGQLDIVTRRKRSPMVDTVLLIFPMLIKQLIDFLTVISVQLVTLDFWPVTELSSLYLEDRQGRAMNAALMAGAAALYGSQWVTQLMDHI